MESSDDAIISKSLDGTIASWNAGAERLYGYRREEVIGRPIALIVPSDRQEELQRIRARLSRGEHVDHFETVRVRKDGRRIHVSLTLSPVVNTDGDILGVSTIARDITGWHRAQEEEREALARLRAVVETAVDGIITIDERGIIETVNPSALRMFGYGPEELIGRNVGVLMPEPYRSEHDVCLSNYRRSGERKIIGIGREVRGRRKDGFEFPMELAVSETQLRDRRIYTGIVRDISRRRRGEHALRESESRFRLMANGAPALIWMSGVDKASTWFNKRWLEFTGRTLEQESGDGWAHGVHPDDLERCVDTYHAAFDARKPFEMEYRLRRLDGEYRWIRDAGAPIHLEDGTFAGYIGSCVDVTDRKLGEEALRGRVARRTLELSAANEQLQHQIEEKRRIASLLATENRILELIAKGAGQEKLLDALCDAIESVIPNSRCAIRQATADAGTDASSAPPPTDAVTVGLDVFGAIAEGGVYPLVCGERIVVPRVRSRPGDALHRYGVRSYWLEPIVAPGGTVVGTLGVYGTESAAPDENLFSAGATAARLAGIVVE